MNTGFRNFGGGRIILPLALFLLCSSVRQKETESKPWLKPWGVLVDKRLTLVVYPSGEILMKGSWIEGRDLKVQKIYEERMVILDYNTVLKGYGVLREVEFKQPYRKLFLSP